MFSHSNSMSRRRDGTITNSTRSCRIELNKGYSYREMIYVTLNFKSKTFTIFNCNRFSVTTSKHQSFLIGHLKNKSSTGPIFRLNCDSINEIESHIKNKTLDKFLENSNELAEHEKLLEFLGYSNNKIKRVNKIIEEKINSEKTHKREKKNTDLFIEKIRTLNYKNQKTLEKALEKLVSKNILLSHIGARPIYEDKLDLAWELLKKPKFKKVLNCLLDDKTHPLNNFLKQKKTLDVFSELGD